jgi:hypothetical protein
MNKNEAFPVLLMVLLLAFAVILVDERWLRTGIAVLPALILAQRALRESPAATPALTGAAERRVDQQTRSHLDELLKHFREFYATCHLMGVGALSPQGAEERAARLERDLNRLLARMTETARARTEPGA